MFKVMFKKILLTVSVVGFMVLMIHLPFVLQPSGSLVSPLSFTPRMALNLWFPKASATSQEDDLPEITAQAAYFVDTENGEVLYQKNSHQKLPIASLVKIMTAIVALENTSFDEEITVSPYAAGMEPDRMDLRQGEILAVEELLYGMFLVSGNDASEALAEGVLGNRDEFIPAMNKKTLQLGMKDTLFINPSGLEEDDKEQYSTAFDVALMSRYAIKQFPSLVEISSTYHRYIPKTSTHQDYDLYSGINLLTTYPGVLGLKTGYTPLAGLTLVTLARRQGQQILGVLLNSQDRRAEAKLLLDYSFAKLGAGN
ncbi:MAG: Peptidase S11 D-alanyl-D-alanine carboxypeptidase 1 [Candidatus Daviesbacteria bacterium GW2011_GWA1_41_61]|nr:MAG: Peptidase S11 D-alanyl-D-alanine carboxypeptidase 1 [Candidatus Daviesbacteria bacterium GW2011_GWB1_41_15]KKS15614.1 MAG: Peptidase S11 D-alanyl-D-alanine carboxypeptidase 1 [Candidatus Daviesbacteria bacterium GW2011_GWA1_41_61]